MTAALLALALAGPPRIDLAALDRVPAALERLRCYDTAAAQLDRAELDLATKKRGAGARWLAARRALAACRQRT